MPKDLDSCYWNESLLKNYSLVAVINNKIVGFGDVCIEKNCIHRLYVDYRFQCFGIESLIYKELEKVCTSTISTYSSIRANFFLNKGFKVVKENKVIRKNITLINFLMEKEIYFIYLN